MKVILLSDVPKLGKKFDIKEVSSGHALNFLIPKGFVQVATPSAIKKIEKEKAEDTERKKKTEEKIAGSLEAIQGMTLEMKRKASEKGHLFASIHKDEIVLLLKERAGVEIVPERLIYDKPIKELGDHTIEVKAGEKNIKINLKVVAE
ncbi:MAG: 50S ribosomal protein L9 [Candidatus Taylorbacteria bacterium]